MRRWLMALGALLSSGCAEGDIPAANAEYEVLVALGSFRNDRAAELCPLSADGEAALTLRHGRARLVRRPGPRRVVLAIEGHPALPPGGKTDRGLRCQGSVEARFSRQRGQWFIDDLRVVRP